MKRHFFPLFAAALFAITLVSCENEGCTDPLAVNYFKNATVDDNSCSYSTNRMIGDYLYIYDSLEHSAVVYPIDISVMQVDGEFDEDVTSFYMTVDWESLTMVQPDSVGSEFVSAAGTIKSGDEFEITMDYVDPDNMIDTSYVYTFIRN